MVPRRQHSVHGVVALLAYLVSAPLFAQELPAGTATTAVGDVAPDPAIRTGLLKNGLRYQLQHNSTPTGQVAFRLYLQAGSLYESESERGIAHMLEHMAFRGSRHLADGEAWKQLQRLGLKSGADANALTSVTSTLYQFDLPTSDAASIETALTMLREIASELTLSAAALKSERGVVQSEARLRSNPASRMTEELLAFNLKGRRVAERPAIGAPETVEQLTPEMLRAFYQAWYRPERAVVLVVGDIDEAAIERDIEKHFGSWQGIGKPGVEPEAGSSIDRAPEQHVFSEPGAPPTVGISWITPNTNWPETRAGDRNSLVRDVGLLALTRRLQQLSNNPNPPVRNAGVNRSRVLHTEQLVSIGAQYDGDDWRKALTAVDTIRRSTLDRGLTQAEVDFTIQTAQSFMQQQADQSASRPNARIVFEMLRSIEDGSVNESPTQALEDFKADTAGITAEAATAALKSVFAGGGPLVFLSTPKPVPLETLASAFTAAEGLSTAPVPQAEKPIWPFADFGRAGTVDERRTVKDLDLTLVRFANGVRLNVKPTKFQANEVGVLVSVGDGRLELPKDRPSAIWVAQTGGFINGGLQGIDMQSMQRALAGKIYKMGFALGDAGFVLTGDTRPADLDTQLQVLAAYVKAPAFRPQAFALSRRGILAQIQQVSSAPIGLFGVNLIGLLHADDPRWTFPKAADVEATQPDDLKALIGNSLAFGPVEITVVGDVDVDAVVQSVAATFGALPRRSSQTLRSTEVDSRFPEGRAEPIVITHQGRDDQGMAAIAWPTTDLLLHAKVQPALRLLCAVVQLRLTEQLRTAAGESYSAECVANSSPLLTGYGFMVASADIQPARSQMFFDTVGKIVADLRAHAPSADELERVQLAEVQKFKQAMQTNQYWLALLVRVQRDPQRIDTFRTSLADLESVKAADLQHAATTYFVDSKAYKMLVRKAAATP